MVKPDKFSKHEVVDRAYCVYTIFNELVRDHPSVEIDKELKKTAEQVGMALFRLYQLAARKFL